MADVAIVNISELAATTSLNGSMLFAVEIPGQGIRKIDKDTIFNLMDTAINVVPSGALNNIITIDGTSWKIRWIDAGSSSQLQVRMNMVYFTDSDSSIGIVIDAPQNRLGLLGATDAVFEMTLDGNVLAMTLDKNFNANTTAYLGTSLDQQFRLVNTFVDGAGTSARSCQRSILKVATTTNASNQIAFPATPKDGYTFELTISGTITALTLTAGTNTIEDALTTATNTYNKWCYDLATTTWIKLI